jgi:DNA repair protein RadC
MKKQNRARQNSKTAPASSQHKPSRMKRIRVRVSIPLRRSAEQGARGGNITIAQFAKRAIRKSIERGPGAMSFTSCREIKVVTVREEPADFRRSEKLTEPKHIFRFWKSAVERSSWYQEDREHIVCFCLDAQYALKSFSLVSIGLLNEALAGAREVFRPAIADAAYAVIIAHNHPSGDPTPSRQDVTLAQRLHAAGSVLNIELLDFIVIGDSSFFSMAAASDWPPSTSTDKQRISSDWFHLRNLRGRLTRVRPTGRQWVAMEDESGVDGLLLKFLRTATSRQLKRLRNLTPLFFDRSEQPGFFVCARDFGPRDTREWQQVKACRALITRRLRHCGIA